LFLNKVQGPNIRKKFLDPHSKRGGGKKRKKWPREGIAHLEKVYLTDGKKKKKTGMESHCEKTGGRVIQRSISIRSSSPSALAWGRNFILVG